MTEVTKNPIVVNNKIKLTKLSQLNFAAMLQDKKLIISEPMLDVKMMVRTTP